MCYNLMREAASRGQQAILAGQTVIGRAAAGDWSAAAAGRRVCKQKKGIRRMEGDLILTLSTSCEKKTRCAYLPSVSGTLCLTVGGALSLRVSGLLRVLRCFFSLCFTFKLGSEAEGG